MPSKSQNKMIFDHLPNNRVSGYCFNWVTNVCKLRNLCHECKSQLHEIINDPILNKMTLNKFLTLSIEDRWEFIIKNELRRNRVIWKYIPEKTNKFAKSRNMNKLERKDLTSWEMYFIFSKYIDYLKKKYIEDIWLLESQQDNPIINILAEEKQISEYFEYNTRHREKDDRNKWFNFKIVKTRPWNTTFKDSLNYGKISDISIKDKQWLILPINKISALTIKNKDYKTLSEQIKHYIQNPKEIESELNISFYKNKPSLLAYLYIIEQIEWAIQSNSNQTKSYVKSSFEKRKEIREKKMQNIISSNKSRNFEIAPQKSIIRAIEKIILLHNWDLDKSTDNCRWTITFQTVWDLQKWLILFVDSLKEYNYMEKNPRKKVTELYFEDKFWNLLDYPIKSSWYRDGKFLIKLWDWNVIELMLQLKDIYVAKNEWFDDINKKSMRDIINNLKFNNNEISQINNIIDKIDPQNTKRGNIFLNKDTWEYKIPYITKIEDWAKIPADFIYNIYRNFEEYDRIWDKLWINSLPLDQPIENRTIMQRLQLIEREIYEQWYKEHSYKIYERVRTKEYNLKHSNLKNNI